MSNPTRGPIQVLSRGLRTLWAGARRRCPKCEQGALYQSYYQIRKTCPHCGVTLQPYGGDSLGVYAVSYFLAILPALVAASVAYFSFHVAPYGVLAVFTVVSGAVLFGFFPHMKGIWIAFVYLLTGLEPPKMRGL